MSVEAALSSQVVLFQSLGGGEPETDDLRSLSLPSYLRLLIFVWLSWPGWRGFSTVLKGMYERYLEWLEKALLVRKAVAMS
jgi:hypothetical protein